MPFTSREDVDFFSHLEMHLRQEHPPLAGRDHMAFRSAYYPVWPASPFLGSRDPSLLDLSRQRGALPHMR